MKRKVSNTQELVQYRMERARITFKDAQKSLEFAEKFIHSAEEKLSKDF